MRSAFVITITCVALAGCGGSGMSTSDRAALDELAAKVSALESERDKLKADSEKLGKRIQALASEVFLFKLRESALLSAGDGGYSVVHADIGLLVMSIEDVKPYADGTKVTLQIGNTTSAKIVGLKARLDWGDLGATSADSSKPTTKDIKFSRDLPPGAWINQDIVLPGVKPDALGTITVSSVSHASIVLRK